MCKFAKLTSIVLLTLVVSFFTGCGGDNGGGNGPIPPPSNQTYTVTFNSNSGSAVQPVTVNRGGTVPVPAAPTRAGYAFEGWYNSSGLTVVIGITLCNPESVSQFFYNF